MPRTIKVTATPNSIGWICLVTVDDGGRTVSEHTVEATASDVNHLGPNSSVEDLVRRSFDFLLEREPPQSILRRFALADIKSYFPDYPDVIRAQQRN